MLGVDGLNLALMVADSGIVDSAVNDVLARSQLMFMAENRGVNATVKNHLLKWRGSVKKKLTRVCETERFQAELALYQEVIHWEEREFFQNIDDVVKKLEWHSAFYTQAKALLNKPQNLRNPMFARYFCDQWYKSLLTAVKQAQVTELESNKEKVLEDLYQRLETMENMDAVADADEKSVGRLWNMASAKLSKTDIRSMKKHAEFLKKNPQLQQIVEQLGRMANDVDADDKQQAKSEELKVVEESSDFATDDIVGIHPTDDLNRMLPNEALFLSHPELEVVFYKHLIDKRLLSYRTKGKARTLRKVTTTKVAAKQAETPKGPIIVAIDASGSMRGFPEQSAKAFAYALMQIALAENRDCYVMIFSTQMITYELTKQDGLREVSDFLSYTFKGGTDLAPSISRAVELMQGDKYFNADLVVISDFMAPKQPKALLDNVSRLRDKQNRFHAVCLSKYGNPKLMSMFDHCWSYHPTLMGRIRKMH